MINVKRESWFEFPVSNMFLNMAGSKRLKQPRTEHKVRCKDAKVKTEKGLV